MQQNSKLVAKALYSPLIEEPDEDFFVFTTEVNGNDLIHEEEIRICPSIIQQCLRPKTDYRVTVVGEVVHSVEIIDKYPRNDQHIDWRTIKEGLDFRSCYLPTEIENLCRKYVLENGLYFGAIDLVKFNDEYFFLELNPNGEWGWLQYPYKIPIAQSLCDLLIQMENVDFVQK